MDVISSYECEHPCCTDEIISGNAIIVVLWDRWALQARPTIWGVKEEIFHLSFCQEFFYIPDICHFFTRAKFLENKIYTEKTRKLRQNTQ